MWEITLQALIIEVIFGVLFFFKGVGTAKIYIWVLSRSFLLFVKDKNLLFLNSEVSTSPDKSFFFLNLKAFP